MILYPQMNADEIADKRRLKKSESFILVLSAFICVQICVYLRSKNIK